MDRDEVVRISRLAAFGGLTEGDMNILLIHYCMEHGKPYKETTIFTSILLRSGEIVPYFMQALEYYEKKYTINKLQNRPDKLGQRQIIYIN